MFEDFPLELISNIVSFIVIGAIIYRFVKYKKRIKVIDGFYQLEKQKKLTDEDKEYIEQNIKEYTIKMQKQEGLLKLSYPLFILIIGVFLAFFEFAEAMIHINIIVVTYIYMYIIKVHYKNYINLLKGIKI